MFNLTAEDVQRITSRCVFPELADAAQRNEGATINQDTAERLLNRLEMDYTWDKVGACYYEIKRAIKATAK